MKVEGIHGALACLATLFALACGGPSSSVREDIRQKLVRHDVAHAVDVYLEWRKAGDDDDATLRRIALTSIFESLSVASPEARVAAVEVAERVDAGELFDPVTRLLDDEDGVVRAAAAAAAIHAHPDAPRVLTRALSDEDPRARRVAVAALGRKVGFLGRRDVRRALDDKDGGVRAAAVTALAGMAEDADQPRFATLAAHDPDPAVRAAAIHALAGTPAGHAAARAGVADVDPAPRKAAFEALVAARDDASIRPLASGTNPDLVTAANIYLRNVDGLRAQLHGATPPQALAIARGLATLGHRDEAIQTLHVLLEIPDRTIQVGAAGELAALGDMSYLIGFAGDADPAVRRQAVTSFPPAKVFPAPLLLRLADLDPMVRVEAAGVVLR